MVMHSLPQQYMELELSVHAWAILKSGKGPAVLTGLQDKWASEPVWTLWLRQNSQPQQRKPDQYIKFFSKHIAVYLEII